MLLAFSVVTIGAGFGYYVYAQADRESLVEIKTVHVFPERIEGEGWENLESLSFQNLDAYSLYQEFNEINSTYPDESYGSYLERQPETTGSADQRADTESPTIERPTQNAATGASTSSATTTPSAAASEAASSTLETPTQTETERGDVADNPSTAPATSSTDTAADSEPATPDTPPAEAVRDDTDTASSTAFRRIERAFGYVLAGVTQMFPLAQGTSAATDTQTTTTAVDDAVNDTDERTTVTEESPAETAATTTPAADVAASDTRATSSPDTETLPATEVADTTNTTTSTTTPTTVASTSTDATTTDQAQVSNDADFDTTEATTETTTTTPPNTLEARPCADDCVPYQITLSGFGVPIFAERSELSGAQLRMSFAAKRKVTRDALQSVQLAYSLDGGRTWEAAGDIEIGEEASNSLNGGYYLFSLPTVDSAEALDDLSVRLTYEEDFSELEGLFVESMWLELFVAEMSDAAEVSASELMADDNYTHERLRGDRLELPDGDVIEFTNTDENEDETLIIKSDRKDYVGLSKTVTYFNVTNTSNSSDTFALQTYFPKGVGEVVSVKEWEPNKPKEIVVPEYRPFTYHCEAGWEYSGEPVNTSLQDISRLFANPSDRATSTRQERVATTSDPASRVSPPTTRQTRAATTSTSTPLEAAATAEPDASTTTPATTPVTSEAQTSTDEATTSTSSTAFFPLARQVMEFVQATFSRPTPAGDVATDTATSTRSAAEAPFTLTDTDTAAAPRATSSPNQLQTYACRNTNVVRSCDSLEGDNTLCRVEQQKVREHRVTRFERGWAENRVARGELPEPGFFKRIKQFVGFAVDEKEVPEQFEPQNHTADEYEIAAGETKYFKMEIAFPPFSTGEFWIEAIGDSEYGLLDPFWQSTWRYKKPITIDNTSGTSVTEQQVFVELDSSAAGFWSNVKSDGGDIRFVREVVADQAWYGSNWSERIPITIQASEIDDDLTNFPIYVDLATLGEDFWNGVRTDGADIRITQDDGTTELAYDLVSIDTGTESGELYFKASTTIASTTDTTFYLYYGNGAAPVYGPTDTYGSENVWDEFEAVYHMDDDPSGSAPQILDSTANDFDGTSEGSMISGDVIDGQLGDGLDFDGLPAPNGDAIETNNNNNYQNGDFTVSAWIEPDDINTAGQRIVTDDLSSDGWSLSLGDPGSQELRFYIRGTDLTSLDTGPVINQNTWHHVAGVYDNVNKERFVYVDGTEEAYEATDTGPPTTDAGPIRIGNSSGDYFNGIIDHVRIASVVRSAAWVSAEHANQSDPATFYATSTPEAQPVATFTELDHWVQHFDHTNQEADIWVQVDELPGGASTTIDLYYGNPDAESTSDEYAPFTYSTSTDLYYLLDGTATGDLEIYSLIDNNEVWMDGTSLGTLNSGETVATSTYSSSTVISALGPISSIIDNDNADMLTPIGFATTTFVVPTERETSEYFIHAPRGAANVDTYLGDSLTPDESFTVATGTTYRSLTDSTGESVVIESDEPILVYHRSTSPGDSLVAYPPTRRPIYGQMSNDTFLSSIADNPDPDVYCSSGTSGTSTGILRGDLYDEEAANVCAEAAQGTGDVVRYANASAPIVAIQQADSDGRESTAFWPEPEFATRYIMSSASQYAMIACSPRLGSVDIEIRNSAGTVLDSGTCTPTAPNTPGLLHLGDTGTNDNTSYTAGSEIVATNDVPFYAYYESVSVDSEETNITGAVQARKFGSLDGLSYTIGAEEENTDAQYEQQNYRWYENNDSLTPVDPWPSELGTVDEGDAISGQNAIDPGEELRLRMNLLANNGTGTVDSTSFALQYAEAETCSAVPDQSWRDVGDIGSTTAAFAGYNASPNDGETLPSVVLSDSDVPATFEEENNSRTIPNEVANGEAVEFDWSITPVSGAVASNATYCFRMIRSTGLEIVTYTTFPQLLTAGPPAAPTLFKRFDNEHATRTSPDLEFSAFDLGNDDLNYQLQLGTDPTFSSTLVDETSNANFDFENINNPSDKAPFTNNARIRYAVPSTLTDGTTYYWRVRAIDPGGSNTYGEWSDRYSFTINTGLTVSEWFQTTDAQFETNTFDNATTTGGAVELNLVGGNLIGEYGTIDLDNGVTSTVTYGNSYTDPVVVASIRYPRSISSPNQPALRVFNKTGSGFDIIADNFSKDSVGSSTADYMVVEAGDWLIDDGDTGLRVYATSTSLLSTEYDGFDYNPGSISGDPGRDIIYPTSFSGQPAVLSMVTTNNSPEWVVSSVYDGTDVTIPPTETQLGVYLNDNDIGDGHAAGEDVDLLVFNTGVGSNDSVLFDSFNTGIDGTINYVDDTSDTFSFTQNFASSPGVALVQQQTMNGPQGGYAQVDTNNPVTVNDITVSIDEGGDADRSHANEDVSIVVFEDSSGDIIRSGNAQITSTAIDFDDAEVGNAWGEVDWTSSGDVTVRVQYQTGGGFQDIPDSVLPGNESGFTSGPINILPLDTSVYDELRLVASLSGVNPTLSDWRVRWGERIDIPELGDPFDNEKVATTTPTFDFTTSDPQDDDLEYQISISTDLTFAGASTTINSFASSSDFANLTSGGDSNPFNSGDQISYTVPAASALTDGETYWWRVRAKDPNGDDAYSPWSVVDSFTVDTSVLVSTWHQTTEEQFAEGLLDGALASTSDSVIVPPTIGEYASTTLNASDWTTITTNNSYDEMVVVAKPSYLYNDTDNFRTVRVRNKTSNSFEIRVEDETLPVPGTTQVDYVVMEAGDWVLDDGASGVRVIAGTAEDVADTKGNTPGYNNGQLVTFSPAFGTDPSAILTVSSDNGDTWVTASMDNGSGNGGAGTPDNQIDRNGMNVGLEVGHDTDPRAPEDIDYIAFERASGTNSGVRFDLFESDDIVEGTDEPTGVDYNQSFTSAPGVVLAQINGMDGGQGGTAIQELSVPSSSSTGQFMVVEIPVDVDGHTPEQLSVMAFESESGDLTRLSSAGGGLTGTIRSETIDFTDGNGPRFEEFYWNATTPGSSAVRMRLEYFDGTNWNLVPDDDWYNSNWTRRVPITLQASQIEEDLTDFPVYLDLADLGGIFWSNVQGTGADIRVTEADGATEVPFDVTYIDTGSNEGELHFQADLASTTDQTFYVYFGNPGASPYLPGDPFYASNVWTNNYDARYQLGEDPTASAPQFTDSAGNGYDATARSGMSAADVVDGQVGRAIDLDGNDGATFDTDFAYPGPFTASMWWNSSGDGFAISTDAGSNEKFGPWTSGSLFARVISSSDDTTLSSPTDGVWHYVVLQRDENDKVDVYIDGTQTRMFGDAAQTGVSDWENFGGQTTQGFVGQLDELRFATGTRSLGWLDTEYNNQANPSAFYLVGAAQQSSGDTLIGNNAGFTGGGPVDVSGLDVGVYDTLRLFATLECASGDCPTLDDWSIEWGEGVQLTGTLQEADRLTNVATGTVRVAVNGTLLGSTGSVSNGSWSIGNVTAFAGDVITVYVEGAADDERAATSFVYNGAGNMSGVELYEGHLTLAGDNSEPLTNDLLASYDNSVAGTADVFFDVDGSGNLSVCAVANCADFNLYITDDIDYRPSDTSAGDLTIGGDFRNEGTFTLDGNTMRVGGNWNNQATSSLGTGPVIFTATAGSYTVTDHTNQLDFPQVTFGEGSGSATWSLQHPLTIDTDLAIEYGTVDRFGAPTMTVSGDITIGAAGAVVGGGTTTFAGSGVSTWSDNSAAGANLGNVVIDGSAKTISVTSDVYANNLTIGANDTLQGGSGSTLHVGGDFTNDGTFTPNTSTLELVDDERGRQIAGTQTTPWYDTDWSSRYPITIQASEIDDDLTDFPVTVDLGDLPSAFWGEVRSDGGDIRVTTGDATTEVAREVSEFDAGSEAGELHFLAPSLSSSTDTTFYIYFGNAAESDYATNATFGAEAVWSDYAGVWHFAEGSGSTAGDSTSNGNDGTLQGSPTWTTGRLGTALAFDGNGDSGNRVQIPSVLDGTATTTVSVWFTQDATQTGDSNWTYVLHSSSDQNVGSSDFWIGRLGNQDNETGDIGSTFGGWSNGLGHTEVPLVADDRFYHVTAVQANGEVRLYVNGQLERTRSQSMYTFTGENWGVGAAVSGSSGFRSHPGTIDSPRISTSSRSAAWIAAEYRNGATTTDFYSVGAAEGEIGFSVGAASHVVTTGGDNFYRLTMNDATTSASFVESSVTILDDFSIATGTITLPTTQTTIGGSFQNTGGVFAHNNSEIEFAGNGIETIELQGTPFLNAFYDVTFTGSGEWTFLDTNATTTNTWTQNNGSVTFPSGQLTVGRDFTTNAPASFDANGGEVKFLVRSADVITTNGSSFNDVRFVAGSPIRAGEYFDEWSYRETVTVQASQIDSDLTDFPVYVDLADFGSGFFNGIKDGGEDIRVTFASSSGEIEVPREVVSASTTANTGEMHFLAPELSASQNTTFYVYYGNATATEANLDPAYAAENVWSNGYSLVHHLSDDPSGSAPQMRDSSSNDFDGTTEGSMTNDDSVAGRAGSALDVDGSDDAVETSDDTRYQDGDFTVSAWIRPRDVTTQGQRIVTDDDNTNGWALSLADSGIGENIRFFVRDKDEIILDTTSDPIQADTWYHVVGVYDDTNEERYIYIDGAVEASELNDTGTPGNDTGDIRFGQSGSSNFFDGRFDNIRIATTTRSAAWIAAEYRNVSTTTDFYAATQIGAGGINRNFTESSVDVAGDVVIESGQVQFPNSLLTVGGSFDNNDTFIAPSGVVRFNATSGVHSIAAGSSAFHELDIANTGGSMAVVENATATAAATLTQTADFTLNSGTTLTTLGTFGNTANGASTTWDGTVRFAGGIDFSVNSKTDSGDVYGTVEVTDDGDVAWWNSSASTYTTQASSSIYSQDHDGVDGDLYIFGDYERDTGTEYWTTDTDFDGTMLTGTSTRQVNVRIANNAIVRASSSTFLITGSSTASTTIDAESGEYAFLTNRATVTAQYFAMTGADSRGLQLLGSTTVTLLDNVAFTIPTGATAITVDASTVDHNPGAQFFNTNFVSGGGDDNVTLSGSSPNSFWWFRDGAGDRYGENFDVDGADPGPIRWDDSNYQIDISGVVYEDDGAIPETDAAVCDGSTNVLRVVVDGGAYTDTTSCSDTDGSFTFTNVSYGGDPTIVVYLNDVASGEVGSVVTRTPTADITDLDLYQNRVMTRHEDSAPMTIERLASYDENDDADLRFVAATGTPDTLTVRPDTELIVASSTTFAPGGNITLESGGSGNGYDGSLHVDDNAVFTAGDTEAHSIGGSLFVDTGGTWSTGSSTYDFTATTSGKTITASSTLTFNDIAFTGAGGGWNLNTDLVVLGDMDVATGTVTGTGDITLQNGSISGNGLVSLGGGTVTLEETNTLGGTQGWTFNNLTLGTGSDVGTTTPAGSATTTILGALTIESAHFLDAGGSNWDLAGNGTVFTENGTFLEDTSRVTYSGTGAANILSTEYYDLTLAGVAGTPTFTFGATGLNVQNDLVVAGAVSSTATLDTNDPVLQVDGDVTIGTNGVLVGSDSTALTVLGSWDNNGTFTSSGGSVTFTSGDAFSIAAGSSSFGAVTVSGVGAATVTEDATSTGAWTLASTSDFTVASGNRLAIGDVFSNAAGGSATTWQGSTLYLYGGGSYEANASTTNDQYDTLEIGPNTDVRTWNSNATTTVADSSGSLYSQDHNGVDGELYIYGGFAESSRSDHWSYATDFDGTPLTGGSERAVAVYVEAGGSVTYSGGSLAINGTSSASTTVAVQGGSGAYAFDVSGGTFDAAYYEFADLDSDGVTFTGTPTITSLDHGSWLVDTTGDAALTVDGTVLDENPGTNILSNRFATTSGVTSAVNVRTNGASVSSWRYNVHTGTIDGEDFDDDDGDPGNIVWDNSTSSYSVAGYVYQSDTATPSTVCGGTANINLVINDVLTASTTCNGSGFYEFEDLNYDSNDTLTVYINDETPNGVTVTAEPLASIGNFNVYEDHLIVRHESSNAIDIADLANYDQSDDPADILFTAVDSAPDTLTLDSDTKLLIWDGKTFEPDGDITTGGGTGDAFDGTIELEDDATLTLAAGESHSFGGNLTLGTNAAFEPGESSVDFTSSGSGRTIDTNGGGFYDLVMSGTGSFTFSDTDLSIANDATLSNSDVTLPTGTTTISGSLSTTGGSFDANGGSVVFDSTDSETVTANGSEFNELSFAGTGSWSLDDANATVTASFVVATGTVTLPSGVITVGADFINRDTLAHNDGTVRLTDPAGAATITLSNDDLHTLDVAGGATFTMTDTSATLRGDLTVASGTLQVATNTLAIGGSLDATGGLMDTASGTLLFNSDDLGETVDPGSNTLHNVVVGGASGGWTFQTATTTNNFSLTAASDFTLASGATLTVGGVFLNTVGGANTEWSGSTLRLDGTNTYNINTADDSGDAYEDLIIGPESDIRVWGSAATTTTVDPSSSLYSQDHDGNDGDLFIYGDFTIGTTTEHWSYATDFNGDTLSGGDRRPVTVSIADGATTTVQNSGTLEMIGVAGGATTTVQNQGSGTYAFTIAGGTVDFDHYAFQDMNSDGVQFSGEPSITALSNGRFVVSINSANAITLATSTLNANPSLLIQSTAFATSSPANAGTNVSLAASSTNAWTFRDHYGGLDGELYDAGDGNAFCGSIRWDDSDCLLTEQTNYRWRNDDGGLGVPASEWFDTDWDKRQRVRFVNSDGQAYTNAAVEITVNYDANMQPDFEDLRFTSDDGTTLIDHWVEDQTPSTEASVWVEVPNLPANDTATVFMYYDNGSATTTSSSTAVFVAVDDFEDNDISEYSGETTDFQTGTTNVYGGTYSLEAVNSGDFSNGGMARFDQTVSQGEIIRYQQYIANPSASSDELCTLFGVQSQTSIDENYAVCLELFGVERITLVEDAVRNDSFGGVTELASTTVDFSSNGAGWYEVEVDWQTDDTMDVALYNPSGSLIATTSASDGTYTSGGYGYTFWTNNGAWDSFTSRPRTDSKPQVLFGTEQVDGGATWAAAENTVVNGFEVGDAARLRLAVENTGLDITGELITIEYASKGTAPSCAAVSADDYVTVPAVGSCGSEAICMATSSHVSNGAATVDLLDVAENTFTAGVFVEDPSNQTSALDIDQKEYTEVEYALQITTAASDQSYCFRVTDDGAEYDAYENIAELSIAFPPTMGTVAFNQGENISLIGGTTTRVYATTTVSDLNGYADLTNGAATSTMYTTSATAACSDDPNNCYIETRDSTCSLTGCSGNSCELQCYADFIYHTDPTDSDGGEFWQAFLEVSDQAGETDLATSPPIDVNTLNAIAVDEAIDYGALEPNATTTAFANPSTTVENIGNSAIDINVEGSDLSDGGSSVIPATQQRFATTSFDYSACVSCTTLSTTTITNYELDLFKPTSTAPPVVDEVYWGIVIPFGTASKPHSGVNTFYAVTD